MEPECLPAAEWRLEDRLNRVSGPAAVKIKAASSAARIPLLALVEEMRQQVCVPGLRLMPAIATRGCQEAAASSDADLRHQNTTQSALLPMSDGRPEPPLHALPRRLEHHI